MRTEDDALILRRIPFREASWIVSCLTPHHGMVSAIARGVRQGRGEVRGALSGFHTVRIEVRARGVEAMGTLVRAEIVRVRNGLPFMPVAAAAALVLGEAVYRFALPGDVQQDVVFAVLGDALDALDSGAMPLAVAGGTLGVLLRLFGYGWRMDACIGCGRGESLVFFSVRRGAVVCDLCGGPYARRLFGLCEALRQGMAGLRWPPELGGLTHADLSAFYQLGVASLVLNGGRALASDLPFRQLAGVDAAGIIMKGVQHDRQGIA
ncbi:MAG: DNA repair protein RecO [Magnetococcales bacterium]|nr:DNA repair protein RecO [Magnetococcales bacterium]